MSPRCYVFSRSLLFQGIKQHNPAAYVLNKTVAKHRAAAVPGIASTTKPDSLNPNTDAVAVRFVCLFSIVIFSYLVHSFQDYGLKPPKVLIFSFLYFSSD